MILPTKYIPVPRCLLGVCAAILECLDRSKTVSELWEDTSQSYEDLIFERFILAADLLFIMGTVDMRNGRIERMLK
ncbi:ABC-three component system middle component 6 [Bombella sp. ESL0385]|uniref:ABC-three component system middle component 6 n=1 Tax=Bombella TaxID=1654741 RepID=UPI00351B8BB4